MNRKNKTAKTSIAHDENDGIIFLTTENNFLSNNG